MNIIIPAIMLFLGLAATAGNTLDTAVAVKAAAPAPAMLFTPDRPLRFRTTGTPAGTPLRYRVRDWRDRDVASGTVAADGAFQLSALPPGYYRIFLNAPGITCRGSRSFAVITAPEPRSDLARHPYSMDLAVSGAMNEFISRLTPEHSFMLDVVTPGHTVKPAPGDRTAGLKFFAEVCRLAGIAVARDRISWQGLEERPGVWRNSALNYFSQRNNTLYDAGIRLSLTYHDAPAWARAEHARFPHDALAVYRFAKALAETFRTVAVWEFWNEPDVGFSDAFIWDFASMMKAAYLGFKAGNPDARVALGAFCRYPLSEYLGLALKNGLAEYTDVFNYHIYQPLRAYPAVIADLNRVLQAHHAGGLPLWITEIGTQAEGGAAEESGIKGIKAHSPAQEMLLAEFIPKSQLLLQRLGTDRNFSFVLRPYNESNGHKDWGLLRRDFTAKPGLVAFAVLTRQLGNAVCQGELKLRPGVKALLFRHPDGSQTVACWSESKLDRSGNALAELESGNLREEKIVLSADRPATLTDAFGTPSVLTPHQGRIEFTATRFPSYLGGLRNLTPSVPVAPRPPTVPISPEPDCSIVLGLEPEWKHQWSGNKGFLQIADTVGEPALRLRVWNLSDRVKRGRITAAGPVQSGLPFEVELKPFEVRETVIRLNPGFASPGEVRLSGEFDGRPITPLVMPVSRLDLTATVPMRPAMRPENWRKNSSGNMRISWDERERALRFDVEFRRGSDRWIYPEHLLVLPEETLAGAEGIYFEIKATQEKEQVGTSLVWFVSGTEREKGESFRTDYTASTGEWVPNLVRFPQTDMSRIRQIRIGLNPRRDRLTFWLRNLRLARPAKPSTEKK